MSKRKKSNLSKIIVTLAAAMLAWLILEAQREQLLKNSPTRNAGNTSTVRTFDERGNRPPTHFDSPDLEMRSALA